MEKGESGTHNSLLLLSLPPQSQIFDDDYGKEDNHDHDHDDNNGDDDDDAVVISASHALGL